jgi:hypothetical protein
MGDVCIALTGVVRSEGNLVVKRTQQLKPKLVSKEIKSFMTLRSNAF